MEVVHKFVMCICGRCLTVGFQVFQQRLPNAYPLVLFASDDSNNSTGP